MEGLRVVKMKFQTLAGSQGQNDCVLRPNSERVLSYWIQGHNSDAEVWDSKLPTLLSLKWLILRFSNVVKTHSSALLILKTFFQQKK